MGKCGILFNRHKWKYPHKNFRICKKCGETQEYSISLYLGGYWSSISFSLWREWLDKALLDNKEEFIKKQQKSKKQALEWLSQFSVKEEKEQ